MLNNFCIAHLIFIHTKVSSNAERSFLLAIVATLNFILRLLGLVINNLVNFFVKYILSIYTVYRLKAEMKHTQIIVENSYSGNTKNVVHIED